MWQSLYVDTSVYNTSLYQLNIPDTIFGDPGADCGASENDGGRGGSGEKRRRGGKSPWEQKFSHCLCDTTLIGLKVN